MTTSLRLAAATCCLSLALSSSVPAADQPSSANPPPIVIERAPESAQPDADAQQALAELRAENQRLTEELQNVVRASESAKAELAAAAATKAKNDAALNETTRELATLQARLAQAESASGAQAELQKKADDAKTAVDALAARYQQLESSLAARTAELGETQARLATETEKRHQENAVASSDLAAKLADAESKLATALRSYSLLQAENDQLKAVVAGHSDDTAERENLRRQNADLEARIAAAPPPPPDLSGKLAETEDKLATALRSYSLLQSEYEDAKAAAARAVEDVRAASSRAAAASAAQISSLLDELRQTQAQGAARATENSQLKTRLAVVGSPPGSTYASPVRPSAAFSEPLSQPASSMAEPAPAQPRTHVVTAGDNLAKISRTYYGTANRWDEILEANRDTISNENVLPIGATLRIP